jgi:hypothetical protein
MKKFILLVLILLVSGCFDESGKLSTTCIKKENINSLYIETTYIIDFKENIVSNVDITYYYSDSSSSTISSIKSSINSNDMFITGLRKNIEIDNDLEYKITYNVTTNDSEEILDKFQVEEKRSDLIKNLKEKGFECN